MSLLKKRLALALVLLGAGVLLFGRPAAGPALARQVETPTLPPWRVEIFEDVNVRAGPGTEYDLVGVLIPGQTSTILGRSPDNRWVKIVYVGGPDNAGWVLREFVRVIGDITLMTVAEAPPTPTLRPTTTPDIFVEGTPEPGGRATPNPDANRLPTFTPPAVGARPTLLPVQGLTETAGFPPALLISLLFVLGTVGGLVSLLRHRR